MDTQALLSRSSGERGTPPSKIIKCLAGALLTLSGLTMMVAGALLLATCPPLGIGLIAGGVFVTVLGALLLNSADEQKPEPLPEPLPKSEPTEEEKEMSELKAELEQRYGAEFPDNFEELPLTERREVLRRVQHETHGKVLDMLR